MLMEWSRNRGEDVQRFPHVQFPHVLEENQLETGHEGHSQTGNNAKQAQHQQNSKRTLSDKRQAKGQFSFFSIIMHRQAPHTEIDLLR